MLGVHRCAQKRLLLQAGRIACLLLGLLCLLPLVGCQNTPAPASPLTLFAVPGSPDKITSGPDGALWFTTDTAIGRLKPAT